MLYVFQIEIKIENNDLEVNNDFIARIIQDTVKKLDVDKFTYKLAGKVPSITSQDEKKQLQCIVDNKVLCLTQHISKEYFTDNELHNITTALISSLKKCSGVSVGQHARLLYLASAN
jgi:hypothetical protein